MVTVGKSVVVINGESRPLDVAPIVYRGDVLVPVRVISEGMGAYVQWVPDRHIVAVRYVVGEPPPTEAPPPPAPPPATKAPPPPPAPSATPNPLTVSGYFRSYYFTRQNASNNPGTQFNFSPGAKYVSNGVNQASWANAIALHGDYHWPDSGWHLGGTYIYSNNVWTVRRAGEQCEGRRVRFTSSSKHESRRDAATICVEHILRSLLRLQGIWNRQRGRQRYHQYAVGQCGRYPNEARRFSRWLCQLHDALGLDGRRRRHVGFRRTNQFCIR